MRVVWKNFKSNQQKLPQLSETCAARIFKGFPFSHLSFLIFCWPSVLSHTRNILINYGFIGWCRTHLVKMPATNCTCRLNLAEWMGNFIEKGFSKPSRMRRLVSKLWYQLLHAWMPDVIDFTQKNTMALLFLSLKTSFCSLEGKEKCVTHTRISQGVKRAANQGLQRGQQARAAGHNWFTDKHP